MRAKAWNIQACSSCTKQYLYLFWWRSRYRCLVQTPWPGKTPKRWSEKSAKISKEIESDDFKKNSKHRCTSCSYKRALVVQCHNSSHGMVRWIWSTNNNLVCSRPQKGNCKVPVHTYFLLLSYSNKELECRKISPEELAIAKLMVGAQCRGFDSPSSWVQCRHFIWWVYSDLIDHAWDFHVW